MSGSSRNSRVVKDKYPFSSRAARSSRKAATETISGSEKHVSIAHALVKALQILRIQPDPQGRSAVIALMRRMVPFRLTTIAPMYFRYSERVAWAMRKALSVTNTPALSFGRMSRSVCGS